MEKQRRWIGIVFAGVVILFAASRIFAPRETTDQNTEPTTVSESQTPSERKTTASDVPEGWQRIERETYTIDAPGTWIVNASDPVNLWLESGINDDVYVDPDIVSVRVSEVLKDGRTFEEIVSDEAWDETDVAQTVAFMKTEAIAPYNEISESDIVISRQPIEIAGSSAVRASRQCLKPCYIEGGPFTDIQYFIDAGDRVFILTARSGIDERAEALLLSAEEVIKTISWDL